MFAILKGEAKSEGEEARPRRTPGKGAGRERRRESRRRGDDVSGAGAHFRGPGSQLAGVLGEAGGLGAEKPFLRAGKLRSPRDWCLCECYQEQSGIPGATGTSVIVPRGLFVG